jgi:phosphoglycolate phosphatase
MASDTINLVTFDIDGTICVSDKVTEGVIPNAMHHAAFSHAFKVVCGFEGASINEVSHHGMTDPLILLKVQLHRGLSQEAACANLEPLKVAMVEYALANEPPPTAESGLVLLPGVKDLLESLHGRHDVRVGLVTGNLEPIAWSKMKALGVRHLFSEPAFGGFGSDFCGMDIEKGAEDRAQLVRLARKRLEAAIQGKTTGRCFHIGDAPNDVSAAHLAGAEAIGVTTGIFKREELLQAAPSCVVLENLSATDQVLAALGLKGARENED